MFLSVKILFKKELKVDIKGQKLNKNYKHDFKQVTEYEFGQVLQLIKTTSR